MADQGDKGLLGAHTPAETGGDRAALGDHGGLDQAATLGGADPGDLLSGLADDEAADTLELIAETALEARRGRGRPVGALNRKNADTIAYLQARGHRDPWVTLSLIQSADFAELCAMVGATKAKEKLAVLKLQQQAASDIMGYHHAKKPQQLDLKTDTAVRPMTVIGEPTAGQRREVGGVIGLAFLAAVQVEKPNEINGEFVRDQDSQMIDAEKPSDNNDMMPSND